MVKFPAVSVILSVYNGETFLKEAIDSILSQTFTDFELIIIDDGSTDKSLDIIKKYQTEDERILVIKNNKNMGLPSSLNKGIRISRGKYIVRHDADDVSVTNRLKVQYEYMEKYPDLDLLGSDNYYIDIDGQIFSENVINKFNIERLLLSRKALFAHGTAFIRKKTLFEIGLYNENFYYTQDRELWLRFYFHSKIIKRFPEKLYLLRLYSINSSKKIVTKKKYSEFAVKVYKEAVTRESYAINKNSLINLQTLIKKTQGEIENNPDSTSDYWFYIGRQAIKSNKYRVYGRKCILKSIKLNENETFNNRIIKFTFFIISYLPIFLNINIPAKIKRIWNRNADLYK